MEIQLRASLTHCYICAFQVTHIFSNAYHLNLESVFNTYKQYMDLCSQYARWLTQEHSDVQKLNYV
jgi:hypothetical protein